MKNVTDIFIDIDGTLTDKKRRVSSYNKKVLKKIKNKSINLILCTGRACNYTKKISKKANTSNYIISCNGAIIHNYETNEIVYSSVIDYNILKKTYEQCNNLKLGIIFNALDKRYCNSYLKKELICDIKTIHNFNELDKNIYQMVVRSYNLESMKTFANQLDNDLQIVNASTNYIKNIDNGKRVFFDITNKGVNKGNAIKKYQKHFKIKKENCMCFGDHINDLTMFNECMYSVAMKNAKDTLKNKANYVTDTNDENGVGKFLHEHFLRR